MILRGAQETKSLFGNFQKTGTEILRFLTITSITFFVAHKCIVWSKAKNYRETSALNFEFGNCRRSSLIGKTAPRRVSNLRQPLNTGKTLPAQHIF
jgi:hypothetical protein